MDKLRRYWKPLIMSMGAAAFSMIGWYFLYKKYKHGKLRLPFMTKYSQESIPLTKEEAMHRAGLVSDLHYSLFFQLNSESFIPASNTYSGATLIEFTMASPEDIFLDFSGKISTVVINSQVMTSIDHRNGRLHIAKKFLSNINKVYISYKNTYSSTCNGMTYYQDPADLLPYIYTHFQHFFAHTVFPCFDQPNLKAKFKVFVACESKWKVISSANIRRVFSAKEEIELKVEDINKSLLNIGTINEGYSLFEFDETVMLSIDTLEICAGHFIEYEDVAENPSNEIPTARIFCRQSLEKSFSSSFEIFHIITQVSKWIKANISSQFPYTKIDHVFVPKLPNEALEGAGCIIYEDNFLDPTLTPNERTYFHIILAHELIHTFFGNYVTPEWWDDLWLSESLATFLSHLSMNDIQSDSTQLPQCSSSLWLMFSKFKGEGFIHDQYKTTHKICDIVKDTRAAEVIFDEITYYKGAAVLKYFYHVVGREIFFKAMQMLIMKYHDKNVNYSNFCEILNSLDGVGRTASPLAVIEPFLTNTGLVQLESDYKTKDDEISEFTITQVPCPHAPIDKYYNHIFDVLLIYENEERILSEIEIKPTEETRVHELENIKIPKAIVLNAGDKAYMKQIFPKNSIDYLIDNTYKIKNPVNRLVVSRDLYEMVLYGGISQMTYIQFAKNLLKREQELAIVEQVLSSAVKIIKQFMLYEDQIWIKEDFFDFILKELYDRYLPIKKTLLNFLIDLVVFDKSDQITCIINILKPAENKPLQLLRGSSEMIETIHQVRALDLLHVDDSTKTRLLETIYEASTLTEKEKKHFEEMIVGKDYRHHPLDAIKLNACVPDLTVKENIWQIIVNRSKEALDQEYEAYMKGFARKSQYQLLKDYFKVKFFDEFEYVKNNFGEKYAVTFFENINPGFVISEKILKSFIDLNRKISWNEVKLKSVVEKEIEKLQLNLKVAKKGKNQSIKIK